MGILRKQSGMIKVLVILLVGMLFLIPKPTQAATTCTWTGAVSVDWHTAGNWSCGVVPGSADTVIIANRSNAPVIKANVQITALTVDAGAQVTVNAPFRLTVTATVSGSGAVNGLLRLAGCAVTANFAGTVDQLLIETPPGYLCPGTVTLQQNLTVTGDLTLKTAAGLYGSQLLVKGNVISDDTDGYRNYQNVTTVISLVGTGDQTLSGAGLLMYLDINKPSGNVVLPQQFSLSSFSDNGGDGALTGSGTILGTLRITGCNYRVDFAGTVEQLVIDMPPGYLCGGYLGFTQNLTVTGNLTLKKATVIYGSQLLVKGNVISDDTDGYRSYQRVTTVIRLVGTGDQTISGTGALMYLNINKPSGNVVLPQPFTLSGFGDNGGDGALTGSGAILGTLRFSGCNYRVDFAGTVEQLTIDMPLGYLCGGYLAFARNLTVTGDLTLKTAGVIYGNQILVGGNVVSNDTDGYRTYQQVTTVISLVGTTDQSISGSGMLMYLNINKPSGNVVLPQPFTLSGFGDNGGDGALTGSGAILGTLRFSGCNYRANFTGTVDQLVINMQEGYLCLGVLTLEQNLRVTGDLTLTNAAGLKSGKLIVSSNVVSNDSNYSGTFIETVIQLVGSGAQTISGSGRIHDLELAKPSGAVQFLSGFTTTFNSVLVSLGQWLLLDGDAITAPVTVSGGTLGGTGRINGAVTVNSGGTLTAGHSPGILTINGTLALNSGATFYVEINGDTPGTQHDQVAVNGAVAINGASLAGATGGTPTSNIILIANDGTDAIGGTRFAGAATNGTAVLIGGQTYSINYNGGTGNDLAFTALAPEIDVKGNSVSIVSGDSTPSASDHSDFGSVNVSSGTVVRTFTIQNTGAAALSVSTPTLSGANAGDFSITSAPAASVAANGSTTFQVTFDPSAPGVRTATINIGNNDSNENPYTFAIQGTGDQPSTDADSDGVADASDNCPAAANADQLNSDNDAQGNACDTDDDNDGVLDVNDAFPLNAAEAVDTDGDGTGNNADTDDDNDGVADVNDAFPLNAAESVDTDGDGIGNNADTDDDGDSVLDGNDVFPLNPNESADTDHDGIGNNADSDDDNDGVADVNDAFPLNAAESLDTDGDGIGNNADTDDDNDGVNDDNDAFPLNASEAVDTDHDGIGNNADSDDDGDSVLDANDAFSLDPNESLDTDGDGIGNNADTDDDNDSILDVNDAFPLNPNETADNDSDGIGNNTDPDDDNDGVADVNDAFPLNASEAIDSDHDGVGDNGDPDDDNDGVNDDNDAFPLNASESLDTDGDTIGNNADTDDDGDGVLDVNDAFPLNPNESLDSDGDGIGNNADPDNDNDGVNDSVDAFPLDPTESLDTDHDGIGNNADPDDDNDDVADANDAFPLNPAESLDTDHDGTGNNADPDDDDDNVADANDAFPLNAAESVDTDGDGIGNNADTDDDDDSVLDANDAFPLDAAESVDTDGDGIGNNADPDDDDDSVLDANDAFPLNAAESLDTDGDAIGNNADPDDDNDGIADATDAFPLNPNETVDNDGDGIGNNADPDDDNDGVADATDAFPLNASESVDSDHDGIGNNGDPDDDNDGVNDSVDAFPLNPAESVDTDHDGVGNNADSDDDGDGVTDANDAFPLDANESADTDHDGIGNNADPDDDNDGVNDNVDAFPLNSAESLDTDGDGIGNNADADDDNDGVPDAQDPFPTTRDTIPPVITLAVGPLTLWPPDHQYVTIPIANFVLNATDATDSQVSRNSVTITKVTSDEVEEAADDGDGNTLKDMVIATDGKAVDLRAERQGGGNGRVYTIHVQVSDRGGNTTTATFKVQVPKSQGKNQAVDDGPVYTVTRPVGGVAAASVDRGSLTDEAAAVDKASQTNRLFLPVVKR